MRIISHINSVTMNDIKESHKRIYWMDVTRALAIILVVLTHAHEQSGLPSLVQKSLFYSIDRLGVPLFFMLSGALLLPRAGEIEFGDYYKKYWKRVLQFIILFFAYTVATNLTYYLLLTDCDLCTVITQSFMRSGLILGWGTAVQMWYMNVIIAFYLFAPFIARLIIPLSTKYLSLFIIFLVPCFIPLPFLPHLSATSLFHPYLVYFIVGYMIINRITIKNGICTNIICLIIMLLCIGGALVIDCERMKFVECLHHYHSSPCIFFGSIALLILVRNIFEKKKSRKLITCLSKHSFGIFLVHHAFLYGIMKMIPPIHDCAMVVAFIYAATSFTLSWGFVAILSQIPYARKLVL